MSLPDLSHIDPDLVPILQGLDVRISKLENVPIVPNVITWKTVPTVSFTQGVPSSFDVTALVSNSLNLPLTITLNGPTLPTGVSFDGKKFNYNGTGLPLSSSGFSLTADDGRTP